MQSEIWRYLYQIQEQRQQQQDPALYIITALALVALFGVFSGLVGLGGVAIIVRGIANSQNVVHAQSQPPPQPNGQWEVLLGVTTLSVQVCERAQEIVLRGQEEPGNIDQIEDKVAILLTVLNLKIEALKRETFDQRLLELAQHGHRNAGSISNVLQSWIQNDPPLADVQTRLHELCSTLEQNTNTIVQVSDMDKYPMHERIRIIQENRDDLERAFLLFYIPSPSPTHTATATPTWTPSPTLTFTPTPTFTATPTWTPTLEPTLASPPTPLP